VLHRCPVGLRRHREPHLAQALALLGPTLDARIRGGLLAADKPPKPTIEHYLRLASTLRAVFAAMPGALPVRSPAERLSHLEKLLTDTEDTLQALSTTPGPVVYATGGPVDFGLTLAGRHVEALAALADEQLLPRLDASREKLADLAKRFRALVEERRGSPPPASSSPSEPTTSIPKSPYRPGPRYRPRRPESCRRPFLPASPLLLMFGAHGRVLGTEGRAMSARISKPETARFVASVYVDPSNAQEAVVRMFVLRGAEYVESGTLQLRTEEARQLEKMFRARAETSGAEPVTVVPVHEETGEPVSEKAAPLCALFFALMLLFAPSLARAQPPAPAAPPAEAPAAPTSSPAPPAAPSPPPAAAPAPVAGSAAAEALFAQGRDALAAGDLETACARFRASDALEAGAGVRANLGVCEEKRGHVASAWSAFRSALAKLPPGDVRREKIEKRIADLEPRLPKLLPSSTTRRPRDTRVTENGTPIGLEGTWGIPLPLDPGAHQLEVVSPLYPPRTFTVELVEGKTKRVTVTPLPSVQKVATETHEDEGASAGPYVVGGIGLAALIVGIGTGAAVLHEKSINSAECSSVTMTCTAAGRSAADAGHTLGPITTVGLVLGGAGLAAAVFGSASPRSPWGRRVLAWV
jgi:hypothetical protein